MPTGATPAAATPTTGAAVLPRPGRCAVMGVLNVTADSFSDGGRYLETDAALDHGRRLVDEGADLVDVGGESTRPGAARVDADEEARRVLPVVRALRSAGVTVSVDTMHASVARRVLEQDTVIVNDVSGGLADPDMLPVVAEHGCPVVLMHWVPAVDYASGAGGRSDHGGDVVAAVRDHLARRVDAALAAGVAEDAIVLDPGLGFAKDSGDNWALLHGLDRIVALGPPVLVAASRKRFLGTLLPGADGAPRPATDRDAATAAVTALSAAAGAWGVRVHDVRPSADAVAVAAAWTSAGKGH